ncbi:hypothetical protein [Chitinibacter tainanensis]|uniref:hypothetical protein n=1 Tax=Chitinibacter tainanensis TaxID=230667 RepID=UPI00048A8BF8|nr:hypothetical protein [Chitinibacter tainanensis]
MSILSAEELSMRIASKFSAELRAAGYLGAADMVAMIGHVLAGEVLAEINSETGAKAPTSHNSTSKKELVV